MNREERRRMAKQIKIETGKAAGPDAPQLVGRRIPGVRLDRTVPLADQVTAALQQAQVAPQAPGEALEYHVPAVAPLNTPQGGWGVICIACSDEAREYVYPCEKHPDIVFPPQILVPWVPPTDSD